MSILFAISLLAFIALLWASLSMARHLRRSHPVSTQTPSDLFPQRTQR